MLFGFRPAPKAPVTCQLNSSGTFSNEPDRDIARERRALRRAMRVQRRALDYRDQQRLSVELCRRLSCHFVFLRARRIAAYLSNESEPDLSPLLATAAQQTKRVYLPALHGNSLWFLPLEPDSPMVRNQFGIPEPSCHPDHRIKPFALDLALVPLVAFDDSGARLGMGGGYYDRSFAYLNRRTRWQRPRLVGVGFEFQRAERIPSRPWDVRLDGVVTERGLYLT